MTEHPALSALAGATWRKSSRTTQTECVEVADVAGWVGVRDSKLGAASPILAFTVAEWRALVAAAKSGAFDLSLTR
jgi:hypothetical protein